MIGEKDKALGRLAMALAKEEGASDARVTITRSTEDLISTLNGEIDKITHCSDSSLSIAIFADSRYGTFSTNKLDEVNLRRFIKRAADLVKSLDADAFRSLPKAERYCTDASEGNELDLLDKNYPDVSIGDRIRVALEASVKSEKIISEEGEYSDSLYESLVMDTQGLCAVHRENCFDYGVEVTVGDGQRKYSSYGWDCATRLDRLDARACGQRALDRALAQTGSGPISGKRCNMVVDREVSSKMISPILRALSGSALQQNDSFLLDCLGKKTFHEGMTLRDAPFREGENGSRLFDSEGVATWNMPIIEKGVVKNYFLTTYMAAKMGLEPTVDSATRPLLEAWPAKGLERDDLLRMCGDGILVTEFNGGNCNSTTGDFSYGIEGFEFKDGKISRPVSGMLVTGNYLSLWKNFIAAADDLKPCMSKLIPTLAFSNVDFNGQ